MAVPFAGMREAQFTPDGDTWTQGTRHLDVSGKSLNSSNMASSRTGHSLLGLDPRLGLGECLVPFALGLTCCWEPTNRAIGLSVPAQEPGWPVTYRVQWGTTAPQTVCFLSGHH